MRKFTILFLVFLCLTFNIVGLRTAFAGNKTFKEGIYKISDLNILPDKPCRIQNISKTKGVRVFIFDEEYTTMQNIKLEPNSPQTDLVPMKPNYKLVVAGKGEITITPTPESP